MSAKLKWTAIIALFFLLHPDTGRLGSDAAWAQSPKSEDVSREFQTRVLGWGKNTDGQLGKVGLTSPEVTLPIWSDAVENNIGNQYSIKQIEAGYDYICMLRSDATVWCWGDRTEPKGIPLRVENLPPIASIDMGGRNGSPCATDKEGNFWCWNKARVVEPYTPVWVDKNPSNAAYKELFASFRFLSVGTDDECAITDKGAVWCWGATFAVDGNMYKRHDKTQPVHPVQVELPQKAVFVEAGFYNVCALLMDQTERCWNKNLTPNPKRVLGDSEKASQIFAGWDINCVLRQNDGSVWCWDNRGSAGADTRMYPVETSPGTVLKGIVKMGSGNRAQCGIDEERFLWCWDQYFHALKDEKRFARKSQAPDYMGDLSNVMDVAGERDYTIAIVKHDVNQKPQSAPDAATAFLGAVQTGDFDGAMVMYIGTPSLAFKGHMADKALLAAITAGRIDVMEAILSSEYVPGQRQEIRQVFFYTDAEEGKFAPAVLETLLKYGFTPPGDDRARRNDAISRLIIGYRASNDALNLIGLLKAEMEKDPALGQTDVLLTRPTPNSPRHIAWKRPCNFGENAEDIYKFFPIVAEGKFEDGEFSAQKVYKGFQGSFPDIAKDDLPKISADKMGKQVLLLAEYDGLHLRFGPCSRIFDERELGQNPGAQILIAAVLFEAKLKTLPPKAQSGKQSGDPATNALRDANDYLRILELSREKLRVLLEARILPDKANDHYQWEMQGRTRRKDKADLLCDEAGKASSAFFPPGYIEVLQELGAGIWGRLPMTSWPSPFEQELGALTEDFSRSLMAIGDYEAALPGICQFGSPASRLLVARGLGRNELINGKKFDQLRDIRNADLSGLVLKGLRAGHGNLENVNLANSDLSGADLSGADLSKAKLEQTKLYFAFYDCNTKFPASFDPILNHMVFRVNYRCKAENETRLSLAGITINPFYPKDKDYENYDVVTLGEGSFGNADARNSNFGRIDCKKCKITNVDFSSSVISLSLTNAEISDTSFVKADLQNSRWENSSFKGSDFSGAKLDGITARNCSYDASTKWPDGFDPEKLGLIRK